jgi:hypothetical protein
MLLEMPLSCHKVKERNRHHDIARVYAFGMPAYTADLETEIGIETAQGFGRGNGGVDVADMRLQHANL